MERPLHLAASDDPEEQGHSHRRIDTEGVLQEEWSEVLTSQLPIQPVIGSASRVEAELRTQASRAEGQEPDLDLPR